MSRIKITIFFALNVASCIPADIRSPPLAEAETNSNQIMKGVTMHGEPGITETVEQIMERENKRPNSR